MSLREYQKKRDFARTPEPKGRVARKKDQRLRYVVHRHHASRLHWDVRLEMDGVLASWAVPQGPPLEGGIRRLAVHTEDHPMQYLTFHGVIPDGYGAGTMSIWDTGHYALDERKPKEVKVTFDGEKLKGSYVIVQTSQNEGRDWLMIKHGTLPQTRALDARIMPMLATAASQPFDSPEWAFEPKLDGVRVIAFVEGGVVRLQSRNLRDVTAQYPEVELSCAHALTGAYRAILDGEIVAVDKDGRPSFQLLQPRMHTTDVKRARRDGAPLFFYVFDLLWVDGEELTSRPLRDRVRRLRDSVEPMESLRLAEQIPNDGAALFEAVKESGLEGIVAKRFDSPYVQARSSLWLKIKAKRTIDCVIGGWTEGQGGREKALGALLLGLYDETASELRYVGHVGTGFDEQTLRMLLRELHARESKRNPFSSTPKPNAPGHWVRPELVCTVEFTEFTNEGNLRQPSYQGLRDDVDPKDCRGEEREADPKTLTRRAAEEVRARAGEGEAVTPKLVPAVLPVDGRELRLTNLEKVLFPEDGYTKSDLIRFYIEVSPYLLRYLFDRPLTLKPYPDGIHGLRFYQKDKPDFTPEWVKTWRGWSDVKQAEIEYVLCNDLATLVWLANYTAIEMHPWLSRVDDPQHPDFVMIDVDPQPGASWEDVKTVAAFIRDELARRKLRAFPKTTGSRGIHVLVPIERRYTYDDVRSFVQEIAGAAHVALPKIVTREWQKVKRGPRVMIDYLQNRSGATTAGPYGVRPKPGAPISMPFEWEELDALAGSDQFNFANFRPRLADVGDLLAPSYGLAQRLS